MSNFDLRKYLAEGRLLKEVMDFPELEDEFEGAMDAMVVEPEVYLKDILNASADEIVSDDYYEIMNAVEQGVYSKDEAVKLAKSWAKEKLSTLAEGKLYEESIPSGWKKIDTSNDYEEEERQGRLMGFEAPMSGIEGDEVDNIYIEQDEDEYEVHIMTAFNNPEYEGPFSSKEEALKVAIQKMEDLKKDWDE